MTNRWIILTCLSLLVSGLSCSGSRRVHPNAVELQRDGRFISFSNGTVLDTKHRLMWSSIDFRRDIDRFHAELFCTALSVGGYGDWRLPTLTELQTLHDVRKTDKDGYRVTRLIRISGYVWASDLRILLNTVPGDRTSFTERELAGYMDFTSGKTDFTDARRNASGFRILPVRNAE